MNLDLFKNLIDKLLNGRKLTANYRDKINIEKGNIISNYSKKTSDKGDLYYIYSKNSNNTYNIGIEKDGNYECDIEVKEKELPQGAGVDSILRVKSGRYVFDAKATEVVQEEVMEMIKRLLDEQDRTLNEQRIEGHLYEFVEKSGDTVWLIDKTDYTGECFQETEFPRDILAKEGNIFKYEEGEYKFYSGN